MKIKLKNVGTLKQAEIDLSKDLIILAGPNNTGKTYAAYTVYGVCDSLKNIDVDTFLMSKYNSPKNNIELDKYIHEINISNETTIDINVLLYQFFKGIHFFFEEWSNYQLNKIFATNDYFSKSKITVLFDRELLKKYFKELIVIENDNFDKQNNKAFYTKDKGDFFLKVRISGKLAESPDPIVDYYNVYSLIYNINIFFAKQCIKFYVNNLHINTAERSAINIFSKELSIKRNNIVDQLLELRDSKNGDANQLLGKLQRYSLPIRDSMAISEDLANISRNKSEYAFLADRMEDILLDGRINVSKYGEVQYSPNKSKVKNLSMNLSGSMVKSLSSLVIYFRHLAQKGDFIIIDEPELNLHPDNQRKVARLFGEIINQGFKVMISTHSDYIIRELNNLIMLKSGGEKADYLANKYGYEEKQLIDYQRVGAYLFNNNKNISLEVTEIGFEVGTIDAVINELNNASEEIYLTLFD